jgi:hypothetical protein
VELPRLSAWEVTGQPLGPNFLIEEYAGALRRSIRNTGLRLASTILAGLLIAAISHWSAKGLLTGSLLALIASMPATFYILRTDPGEQKRIRANVFCRHSQICRRLERTNIVVQKIHDAAVIALPVILTVAALR